MPVWNPQAVLDLYHSPTSSTCSGTTKKGLRCRQSMISNADRAKAAARMNIMAYFQPHTIEIETYEDLAYLTLCPRWHRKPGYSQVYEVARQFQRKVEIYCSQLRQSIPREENSRPRVVQQLPSRRVELIEDIPLAPLQRRQLSDSEREPNSETGIRPSSSTSASSQSLQSRRPSQHNQPESTTQLTPSSSTTSTRRSSDASIVSARPQAQQQLTPAQRRIRVQTPPATPLTPSPSSTSPSTPISPPATPRAEAPERPLPSPAQVTTPPQSPSSSPGFPHRKSAEDPCPICYDSLTLESSVYCRRQCGTNVHRQCFNDWRLHQLSEWDARHRPTGNENAVDFRLVERRRDAAVTCVYCRSQWMWEWE